MPNERLAFIIKLPPSFLSPLFFCMRGLAAAAANTSISSWPSYRRRPTAQSAEAAGVQTADDWEDRVYVDGWMDGETGCC